ncbi:group 10 secretory phospholipase A2 [Austrofundulus limnaeus]|uniref:Phospholipase A2 n=1 Tax=Austrofundulus limnaeus TaxID=52670 RepID=A0A2I4CGZ5_AUSLI|nr:PREDICTED: group 10 secretory phospholipase A2-like [Austrofundulus limnaeus]
MALYRTLLLLSVAVVSVEAHSSQREKRGLLELAGAIKCSTGRSALSYLSYGCYCGLGGQGWPRDLTDWCCHKHDCCYGDAEDLGCETKTSPYVWTCEDAEAKCEDLEDRCERFVCKCDREAAKCFRKSPFIQKYALWPDFLCGSEQPMCNIY